MTKPAAAEPTTATPAEVVTETPKVTTAPPAEIVTVPPEQEPEKDAEFWKGKAKALDTENKRNAKRLAELEAAEQARADAAKSELQKAQERADKAEAEMKAAKLEVQRRDIAAKYKVPEALASRIKGETPEEMEADAKVLLESLPVKVPPALEPTRPGDVGHPGETDAERRKRLGL